MSQKYTFTTDEHALVHPNRTPESRWACSVNVLLHGVDQPFCIAVGANAAIAESRAARIAALLNEGWSK